MPPSIRQLIIGLLLLLLCSWHCLAIMFSVVATGEKPYTIYDTSLGNISKRYTEPFFIQNWHLFSPRPATHDLRLYTRYKSKGEEWTDWSWLQEDLLREHHKFRGTTHGKLLYIFMGMSRELNNTYLDQLEEAVSEGKELTEDELSSLSMEVLNIPEGKQLLRYCRDVFPGDPKSLEMVQVMVRNVYPLDYTDYQSGERDTRAVRDLWFKPVVVSSSEM